LQQLEKERSSCIINVLQSTGQVSTQRETIPLLHTKQTNDTTANMESTTPDTTQQPYLSIMQAPYCMETCTIVHGGSGSLPSSTTVVNATMKGSTQQPYVPVVPDPYYMET